MTAAEKHLNKSELQDFKNSHKKTNSMLLGSFNESLLRSNIIPTVVKKNGVHYSPKVMKEESRFRTQRLATSPSDRRDERSKSKDTRS